MTGETIDDAGLEIMRIAFLADHTKIHAGTKRPSFSTQDDTADLLGLLLQIPDMRIQSLKGLHIQRIQLFRTVERQRAEPVQVMANNAVVHDLPLSSAARIGQSGRASCRARVWQHV